MSADLPYACNAVLSGRSMRSISDKTSPDLRDTKRAHRRQVSIMHVFREAAEQGNARLDDRTQMDGETKIAVLTRHRRDGIGEEGLRRHLALDLESLLNTVRLDAMVALTDYPRIAKSVVNFGINDVSSSNKSRKSETAIAAAIRQSLIDHEPRLIKDSIEIIVSSSEPTSNQRVVFEVHAEIAADPADLPLDFVTEVDLGAGKMRMKRLRVQR